MGIHWPTSETHAGELPHGVILFFQLIIQFLPYWIVQLKLLYTVTGHLRNLKKRSWLGLFACENKLS